MTIPQPFPQVEMAASRFDETVFVGILRDRRLIAQSELDRAIRAAAQSSQRLDTVLLELGLLDDDQIASALSELSGLKLYDPEIDAAERFDELASQAPFMKRVSVAPLSLSEGYVRVVVSDPFDQMAAEAIGFRLEADVEKLVATRSSIEAIIEQNYGQDADGTGVETAIGDTAADDIERLKSIASEGSVVKFVADTIAAAVETRASDVHFEAFESSLEIRFRVDGKLQKHAKSPVDLRAAIVSRIKIMANMNISERRRPQDGRARLAVRGRNIDLRISTAPTQFGESIVIRLLDRARLKLDWDDLGFSSNEAAMIERLTSAPHGLFLVTGPTGSGKTTTLYTALSKLNSDQRKIVTVEDPIEYTLPGVNQIQVHPEIDLTFASALRSVLRQDPDVVMVGEIRDRETAENAIRAALMGRMVLSTVHTNSALGAIDRLIDLGVPPFLLAATLRGVMSQRLARKLCPNCKLPADRERATNLARMLGDFDGDSAMFAEPNGCEECASGYQGRSVIAEIVEVTSEIASSIESGASSGFISKTAGKPAQLVTVGLEKASHGLVSLDDVSLLADTY